MNTQDILNELLLIDDLIVHQSQDDVILKRLRSLTSRLEVQARQEEQMNEHDAAEGAWESGESLYELDEEARRFEAEKGCD